MFRRPAGRRGGHGLGAASTTAPVSRTYPYSLNCKAARAFCSASIITTSDLRRSEMMWTMVLIWLTSPLTGNVSVGLDARLWPRASRIRGGAIERVHDAGPAGLHDWNTHTLTLVQAALIPLSPCAISQTPLLQRPEQAAFIPFDGPVELRPQTVSPSTPGTLNGSLPISTIAHSLCSRFDGNQGLSQLVISSSWRRCHRPRGHVVN